MTAVITGVAGQDGVWLARLLLARGESVVGTVAPGTPPSPYLTGVTVVPLDVRDAPGFAALLERVQPATVFNLAAFTSVGASWEAPDVAAVNADAVTAMLEELVAFRSRHGWAPKFFQASSADMYGAPATTARSETTPMTPASPYAKAKLAAHLEVGRFRSEHDLFAASGILFNHESVLRPERFVTRKITHAAAAISLGTVDAVTLGNLEVRRDWGWAAEYAEALRLMLDAEVPDDFVVATGTSHALGEVVEMAFAAAGVADPWARIEQDPALMRPADVPDLVGDPTKAAALLGWRAQTPLADVIARMVAVDLRRLQTGVEDDPTYLD